MGWGGERKRGRERERERERERGRERKPPGKAGLVGLNLGGDGHEL